MNDLKFAIRQLLKNPGFTAVAVLTLALGIGANTTVFGMINTFLIKPYPLNEPDRLYEVGRESKREEWQIASLSYPDYLDIRDQNSVFEGIACYDWAPFNLAGGKEPVWVQGGRVSANLFDVLAVKPLLGRFFRDDDDRPGANQVALISEGLWRTHLGADEMIVGDSITLNSETRTVIGIVPSSMAFPEGAKVWIPLALDPADQNRGANWLEATARLNDGISEEQARADLKNISERLQEAYPGSNRERVFTAISLREDQIGEAKPYFFFLLGAVGFLLLIVCANVSNLLLSRSSARTRELAVRAAIGASRRRLIRQLLAECFLIACLACLLGLAVSEFGVGAVQAMIPVELPTWISFEQDWRVFIFTGTLAVATTFLFGLMPALQATKLDLQENLREAATRATDGQRSHRLQSALVVSEMAVALTLLAGAAVMICGFLFISNADPGFETRNALTATVALPDGVYDTPQKRVQFYRQTLDEVGSIPGGKDVGIVSHFPFAGSTSSLSYTVEGQTVDEFRNNPMAFYKSASPDYFRSMEITLFRGRYFRESDTADGPPVMIVNEPFARLFWPDEDPVGRRIKFSGPNGEAPWLEIVGVVEGAKHALVHRPPPPQLYVPYEQSASQRLCLIARTHGAPLPVSKPIREVIQKIDPNQAMYRVMSLETVLDERLWPFRLFAWLFWIFGACVLALAALGIYGVMAYSVTQRTREFGIRVALGAERRDVVGMILRRGMKLATIGGGIGLIAAFGLTRIMTAQLMEINSTDFVSLLGALVGLGVVALLACYVPARRATRVDPAIALRTE